MKNIMRRAVAFMLMACLLLSVMAPTAFAASEGTLPDGATADEIVPAAPEAAADGSITYNYGYGDNTTGNSQYFVAGDNMGDFMVCGVYGTRARVRASDTQIMDFGKTEGAYLARAFNVAKAGTYDINITTNIAVDVFIMTKAAFDTSYKTDAGKADASGLTVTSAEYVGTIGTINVDDGTGTGTTTTKVLGSELKYVSFDTAGEYVVLTRRNAATNATSHGTFSKMVLTPVTKFDAPTVNMEKGVYSYDITVDTATQTSSNNYPSTFVDCYGDFVTHSKSESTVYKAYGTYLQIQEARTAGNWYALRFAVAKAGNYDIALDISMGKATESDRTLDVHIQPVSALTPASGNPYNDDKVADFTNGHSVILEDESTHTITNYNFASAGEYLIVFELTGDETVTGLVNFEGMTLHPYTIKGGSGTMYSKVSTAVETETSLTLTDDITEDIQGLNGATLDLAGNTIYGKVAVGDGGIVDNGAEKGAVVGTLEATGNTWLPIETTEGTYSFYEATPKTGKAIYDEVNHSVSFWFDLDLADEDTYALIKNGGFELGATLTVGGTTYDIAGMEDAVNAWLDNKGVYDDGDDTTDNNGALCVKVINLDKLTADTQIVVTPVFTNDYVSGMFGGAITYNYTVPAAE